jgi:hypothetical protein
MKTDSENIILEFIHNGTSLCITARKQQVLCR